MSRIAGPHSVTRHYSATLGMTIHLFGENHIKTAPTVDATPFIDFLRTSIGDRETHIYLERSVNSETPPNTGIFGDIGRLYNAFSDPDFGTPSASVYACDIRSLHGREHFNDIVNVLLSSLLANKKEVYYATHIMVSELRKVVSSMRQDEDGYDDSVDFLLFQCDNEGRIDGLLDMVDDSTYSTLVKTINKRLSQVGLTKDRLLGLMDQVLDIISSKNPSIEGVAADLAVSVIKWQSVVLDLYILGKLFTDLPSSAIVYTGDYHSEMMRLVLSELGFETTMQQTNGEDCLYLDGLLM